MDKKQYSQMITFRLTTEKYWQKAFGTLDRIPTVEEWDEFIDLYQKKLGNNWIILNQITIKL